LAIACDNASNMNTMLDHLSQDLENKGVYFDPFNQRVRCLAHIINLAAKNALENFHASGFDNVDVILESEDTPDNLNNTIYKVNCKI
jgi:hypothetical protein